MISHSIFICFPETLYDVINRHGIREKFLLHSQYWARCDKLFHATVHMPRRQHLLSSLSLHFPLHALLNGTDGSAPAITHCIAWLISVRLQVQRCQARAAGLPWLPLRPLILWRVSSLPALAHLVCRLLANCCSQPFSNSLDLFWFRVSSHHQQNLIAMENLKGLLRHMDYSECRKCSIHR